MAQLLILYGHPADPAAFEEYYARQHIPYASTHMPGVRAAHNMKVISTQDGAPAPYYRVSELSYDTTADLRAGINSSDSTATIADMMNFATGGATLLVVEDD